MASSKETSEVPILNIPNNIRIQNLNDQFFKNFNCKPDFFVKVPGRVNIIGEHVDYCGYPVLPMALEQDILVAVRAIKEPELHIRNMNKKYCDYFMEIKSYEGIEIEPDINGKPFWYNYVLCGVKGGSEHAKIKIFNGLQLFIDGNIPPASGLSSSSALVSASCLAFLHAQNASLIKTDVATLCAESERYIGTQGGGMDQAIAFLAEKYSAQYITWQPLHATPVALPGDAVFVVAHSLAEANKAATNDFNRRVVECRLAAKVLASCAGIKTEENIITLSYVQNILNNTLNDMVSLVSQYLPKDIYTKTEICKILNMREDDINQLYLTPNTKHLTEFKLKQRALHVYQEAMRVEDFRKFCSQSASNGEMILSNKETNRITTLKNGLNNKSDIINALGHLMTGSHESLKNLYECSHENLDRIVDISLGIGVHSRLTGAGWGGCIVALCPKQNVEKYIDLIIDEFYVKHCNIDKSKARSYIFATTPNHGSVIYSSK